MKEFYEDFKPVIFGILVVFLIILVVMFLLPMVLGIWIMWAKYWKVV